jgi:hypothetical protein
MSKTIIPPGIELLKTSAQQLENCIDIFKMHSPYYIQLRDILKKAGNAERIEADTPEIVLYYIQILMLLSLSMHGGIFMPNIRTVISKKKSIQIGWDGGLHDQFNFGVFDDNFKKFASSFQKKMFIAQKPNGIPISLVKRLHQILKEYMEELGSCNKKVAGLIGSKQKLLDALETEETQDLIFIIISCLPSEELNALFIYVQQFFPPNLKLELQGKNFDVTKLFQQSSADLKDLMHKSSLYFDLYFSVRMPIIQHITKTKTKDFMADIIKNEKSYKAITNNLKSLKENQIKLRLDLYSFFVKHLNGLF